MSDTAATLHVVSPTKTLPSKPVVLEPKRDWAFGPVTGHRTLVLFYMSVNILLFYLVQEYLWVNSGAPVTPLEQVWSWMQLLWLAAVPMCITLFVGMMMFRHPTQLDNVQPIMGRRVCWRIVTRGDNYSALLSTVRRIQKEMADNPLFPYVIEIVTDTASVVIPAPADDVTYMRVPIEYETEKRTRFKARALHYAMLHSDILDTDWIIHLDEETQPTSSGVKGICAMIREEEHTQRLRVGQGAMTYHRQWSTHPFLTLADNVRTGMDFGPFYLQTKFGVSLVGFHGSYIVIRNDIEKATGGFDFGADGDITEDAFWVLIANAKGHKIRWVEGYLEEQSTQSLGDFLRQRRRWFEGLVRVVRKAPVPLRYRLGLGTMLSLWTLTSLSILYSVAHLFYGFENRDWIRFLANFSWAACATMYLIGLKANLDESGVTNPLKRWGWTLLQLVLVPVFCLMEITAALMAIFKPHRGFHVVKK